MDAVRLDDLRTRERAEDLPLIIDLRAVRVRTFSNLAAVRVVF
jgi:hypothetical protein